MSGGHRDSSGMGPRRTVPMGSGTAMPDGDAGCDESGTMAGRDVGCAMSNGLQGFPREG